MDTIAPQCLYSINLIRRRWWWLGQRICGVKYPEAKWGKVSCYSTSSSSFSTSSPGTIHIQKLGIYRKITDWSSRHRVIGRRLPSLVIVDCGIYLVHWVSFDTFLCKSSSGSDTEWNSINISWIRNSIIIYLASKNGIINYYTNMYRLSMIVTWSSSGYLTISDFAYPNLNQPKISINQDQSTTAIWFVFTSSYSLAGAGEGRCWPLNKCSLPVSVVTTSESLEGIPNSHCSPDHHPFVYTQSGPWSWDCRQISH